MPKRKDSKDVLRKHKEYNSIPKVCFHTMWSGWCEELVERINVETKQDLSQVLMIVIVVIIVEC